MELTINKLQDLALLWREQRGDKPLPSRGDLPVSLLRPWLGNLALIDIVGAVPYFRLCGTKLYERFGGEMTHRMLTAVDDAHGRAALQDCINAACEIRAPAHSEHTQTQVGRTVIFHELCAPMALDGTTIDTVLFASYGARSR